MKSDDSQPPAGNKRPFCCCQPAHKPSKFVIYRDPDGLKAAGGRMALAWFWPRKARRDGFGELERRLDRSDRDKRSCNAPRGAFLAKMMQNVRKF